MAPKSRFSPQRFKSPTIKPSSPRSPTRLHYHSGGTNVIVVPYGSYRSGNSSGNSSVNSSESSSGGFPVFAIVVIILCVVLILGVLFYKLCKYINGKEEAYVLNNEEAYVFKTAHLRYWVKHKSPSMLKFKQPCAIQSAIAITEHCYFEIKLEKNPSVIIGLSPACSSTDPYQVFGPGSISLEANLGEVRLGNDPYVHTVDSPYSEGDIISCRFQSFPDRTVIFFKNGVPSTPVRFPGFDRNLRISIYANPGAKVSYNLGEVPFQYDPAQLPLPIAKPLDVSLPAY